jgi:hypothetical protein
MGLKKMIQLINSKIPLGMEQVKFTWGGKSPKLWGFAGKRLVGA